MTLPKRLQGKRDELVKEWTRGWNPLADETNSVIALNYKKGFKDCANLLLPEIEKLREALEYIASDYPKSYIHDSDNERAKKALQSIEDFLGEKSEGGDE